MPDIKIDTAVPSPQAVVTPRLLTVLNGYASRSDVVLALDLGLAGAAMSVPVTVDVGDYRTRTATSIPIALKASHHTGWFPIFRGAVRNDPAGPLESILWLAGTYETPLGALGDVIDRTVLSHAAQRSLRFFLERLRSDVIDEIQRAEFDIRRRSGS
ncbi:MAG: hypothetical protein ABI186_03865 [Candidatus Elarobacter sp.]